jgi:hypothetical protein
MPKSRFTPTQPKTAAAAPAPLVENKVNESHLKAPAVPALKRNYSSFNDDILGDRNGGGRDQRSGAGTGGKGRKRDRNWSKKPVAPGE